MQATLPRSLGRFRCAAALAFSTSLIAAGRPPSPGDDSSTQRSAGVYARQQREDLTGQHGRPTGADEIADNDQCRVESRERYTHDLAMYRQRVDLLKEQVAFDRLIGSPRLSYSEAQLERLKGLEPSPLSY